MEKNNLYIYIPRDKILNKLERKHQTNDFMKIFYYVKNKKFELNSNNIIEIDIFDLKEMKNNCIYKDCYKSKKDKYFDWYYKIKPEFANLEELYIEKNKKKDKLRLSYNKNVIKQQQKAINDSKTIKIKDKKVHWKEQRKIDYPFHVFFD